MGSLTCIMLLALASVSLAAMQSTWAGWGNDAKNTRFANMKCIDKGKLASGMKVKWKYQTKSTVASTPTYCNGYIYAIDWGSNVYKFNEAGALQWKKNFKTMVTGAGVRSSPVFDEKCATLFVFTQWSKGSYIIALNTADGSTKYNKVVDSHPLARCTASPTYYRGSIYVGMSSSTESSGTKPSWRGSMFKINALNGNIQWRKFLTPPGYTGVPIWGSSPAIDAARGQVCVGTGNNYDVPASVAQCIKRAGSNLAAQSACNKDKGNLVDAVVCFSMATGQVKWARSYNGLDVYMAGSQGLDHDFGQCPILVGDILLAISKSGQPLALNAQDGKSVWGPKKVTGGAGGYSLFGSCTNNQVFVVGLFWYGAKKGVVAGFDVKTGVEKWTLNTPAGIYGPITCTQGVAFVPIMDDAGSLLAVDINTGKRLGAFKTGKTLFCGPSIVKGVMYLGNGYSANGGVPGDTLFAVKLPVLPGAC